MAHKSIGAIIQAPGSGAGQVLWLGIRAAELWAFARDGGPQRAGLAVGASLNPAMSAPGKSATTCAALLRPSLSMAMRNTRLRASAPSCGAALLRK